MFTLFEIFYLLIIHGICDYLLQTKYEAHNKSKEWKALLSHTTTYSMAITFLLKLSFTNKTEWIHPHMLALFLFGIITFLLHTLTDYFTSRWTSYLYIKGDDRGFFRVVELDQLLHYGQIFTTYYFLFKV